MVDEFQRENVLWKKSTHEVLVDVEHIYIYYINISTHQLYYIICLCDLCELYGSNTGEYLGNKPLGYKKTLLALRYPNFLLDRFLSGMAFFSKAILLAPSMYHPDTSAFQELYQLDFVHSFGQIIYSDLTRSHPFQVAEEGKSAYFREI